MELIIMKKSTGFLLSTAMLLLGIIVGFLFSPVKGGLNIGNNSGNQYPKSDEYDDENDIAF